MLTLKYHLTMTVNYSRKFKNINVKKNNLLYKKRIENRWKINVSLNNYDMLL